MKTTSSGAALGSSPASAGGRLNGKDFINIGIFTAIYFVIVFAVACLGFIPIFMVLICGIIPLVAGIPYMLYLTRVKKFGMITSWGCSWASSCSSRAWATSASSPDWYAA